jgi:hypothetical protein
MEMACRLEQWRTREPHSIVWYEPMSPPTRTERHAGWLKPFSRETWFDWFDLAWEVVMVLEACDQIISRSLLQPQRVWLLEVGTAEELVRGGWELKQSFRREYEYKPRSSASVNVPS